MREASLRPFGTWLQKGVALAQLPDLTGKVVVVTGGTSGVGESIVEQVASAGATTVFTARDQERGARTEAHMRAATGNSSVHAVALDLASLATVGLAAEEILHRWERLDVLICNAGLMPSRERALTSDGFELAFGVNHVAHAHLTWLLEERLRASAPSRVVVVASEAHRRARRGLDFADLDMSLRYRPQLAYSRSKLANVLFAAALARRLDGTGVLVFSAHPGGVDTPMMRAMFERPGLRRLYEPVARRTFLSPADAAAGVLRVALDPGEPGRSGAYFELGVEKRPGPMGRDRAAAERLWDATQALLAAAA
jgi:NAD(P)-dependent dehydrogenase (short-subunit alcohol dehydrogenase family)